MNKLIESLCFATALTTGACESQRPLPPQPQALLKYFDDGVEPPFEVVSEENGMDVSWVGSRELFQGGSIVVKVRGKVAKVYNPTQDMAPGCELLMGDNVTRYCEACPTGLTRENLAKRGLK